MTLLDASSPINGNVRLLGTGSAFVFLWRADEGRPKVIPIQSIHRIGTAGRTIEKSVGSDVPEAAGTAGIGDTDGD